MQRFTVYGKLISGLILFLFLFSACSGSSGSNTGSSSSNDGSSGSNDTSSEDTTPPGEVTITGMTTESDGFTLSWTDPGDSDLDHIIISWTPGNTSGNEAAANVLFYSTDGLEAETEYEILLRTVDVDGNTSDGTSITLTTIQAKYIFTAEDLIAIRGGADGYDDWTPADHYILMNDIDLAAYASGDGWEPICDGSTPFTGIFDGKGLTIGNLTIDRSQTQWVGLFGSVDGGTLRDINLADVRVTGGSDTGGLVGSCDEGVILGCTVTGEVTGTDDHTGGLAGSVNGGTVTECSSAADVTGGASYTGGLAGYNSGSIDYCSASGTVEGGSYTGGLLGYHSGSLTDSYAEGDVSITVMDEEISDIGGLIGRSSSAPVTRCFANGEVTIVFNGSADALFVGGFIGRSYGDGIAVISRCYATGNVTKPLLGEEYDYGDTTGGFIGSALLQTIINDCYATGNVSGDDNVGGFIGRMFRSTLTNCYSIGAVSGDDFPGGFAGDYHNGEFINCFYDSETSGYNSSDNQITPKTTAEMKDIATFTDTGTTGLTSPWDFSGTMNEDAGTDDIWAIDGTGTINGGYPYLSDLEP